MWVPGVALAVRWVKSYVALESCIVSQGPEPYMGLVGCIVSHGPEPYVGLVGCIVSHGPEPYVGLVVCTGSTGQHPMWFQWGALAVQASTPVKWTHWQRRASIQVCVQGDV